MCPECGSDREPLMLDEFYRESFRGRYKSGEYVKCVECGAHYERIYSKYGELVEVRR